MDFCLDRCPFIARVWFRGAKHGKKVASNFETVLPKFREIAHKVEPTLDANADLTLHEYSMELEFGQLWKRSSRHI